jgi:hypothetical protein
MTVHEPIPGAPAPLAPALMASNCRSIAGKHKTGETQGEGFDTAETDVTTQRALTSNGSRGERVLRSDPNFGAHSILCSRRFVLRMSVCQSAHCSLLTLRICIERLFNVLAWRPSAAAALRVLVGAASLTLLASLESTRCRPCQGRSLCCLLLCFSARPTA